MTTKYFLIFIVKKLPVLTILFIFFFMDSFSYKKKHLNVLVNSQMR